MYLPMAVAQTPPDAGALRRQIEQDQSAPLPPRRAAPVDEGAKPAAQPGGAQVEVKSFTFAGNTLVSSEELARAVAPWTGKAQDLAGLQAAAAAAGDAYRSRGWVVRAQLPRQDVSGGVVLIEIVEGRLGKVFVESNTDTRVSSEQASAFVGAGLQQGEPLTTRALDRGLMLADDLPGAVVAGRLQAGAAPGETDVALQLAKEPFLTGTAGLDNYGSHATGSARASASLGLASPLGIGDFLGASLIHSQGSDYLRGEYTVPVGAQGLRLGVNGTLYRYDIVTAPFDALDAQGTSTSGGLQGSYPIIRSRNANLVASANWDHRSFDNQASGQYVSRYGVDDYTFALNGSPANGNVLGNDTDVDGVAYGETRAVQAFDQAGVAGTLGVGFTARYGTLTLNADGSYTYVVDDANPEVQALRTGLDRLTEVFNYTMVDAAGAASASTLTITIHGRNDTPRARDDLAVAVEAGGVQNTTPGQDATGNVLDNDSDVDSAANGEGKSVLSFANGDTGSQGAAGSVVTGLYGQLVIGSDGSFRYVVDNDNPAVQASSGATGLFSDKNVGQNKSVGLDASGAGVLTGADAGNYVLASVGSPTATAGISAATLTVGGSFTASDKVYDATRTAQIDASGLSLAGVMAGDTVNVAAGNASGVFSDKNVGQGKSVSLDIDGHGVLTGADAGNYVLDTSSAPSTTASITPKSLTVGGSFTASDRVYDATKTAQIDASGLNINGVIAGDTVSVATSGATGVFDNKNVGQNKSVGLDASGSGVLTGTDAGNYVLNSTGAPTATASITPKALTVAGSFTAEGKVYDATRAAQIDASGLNLGGVIAGDAVNVAASGATGLFADKNVGNGKNVALDASGSGLLTGSDAGNYMLDIGTAPTTTASITPKALTVRGITAEDKVYDGTRVATVVTSSMVLDGLLAGDVVTIGATGQFSDKNVGANKFVGLTTTEGGADAGNYLIARQAGTTAAITPKSLNVSGVRADDKVYDGTTAATVNVQAATIAGVVAGDSVSISGAFGDKNAGANKTVGLSSTGADGGNYTDPNHQGDATKAPEAPAAAERSTASATRTEAAVASVASAPAVPSAPAQSLLVVDSRVEQREMLSGQAGPGVTVLVVDTSEDGLAAISTALASLGQVDSIQILSHGAAGQFTLGNRTISSDNIGQLAGQLQGWSAELTADADIQLYGCSIGAGPAGQTLVNELARLTGADVGASSDATGSAAEGGNWTLETRAGEVDKALALSATTVESFQGLLADAAPTVTLSSGGGDVLLGDTFTFTASFTNPSSQVGFAPYIDLYIPTTGKDGAGSAVDDGISFQSATFQGVAIKSFDLVFDANGQATHPLAKGSDGLPLVINAADYGLRAGDHLVVLQLPNASIVQGQPPIDIVVTMKLSSLADTSLTDGAPNLTVKARGGFQFGNTSADDSTIDPTLVEAGTHDFVVHPTMVELTVQHNIPDGQTVTGPNYPRSLTITASTASDQTLTNVKVAQDLPGTIKVTGIVPGTNGMRTGGNALTESFSYLMRDTQGATSEARLVIVVRGADDSPVARDDSNVATDQIVAPQAGGNVLPNDSDVDAGDALQVTAIRTGAEGASGTAGQLGQALAGRYGTLVIHADGSYTYSIDMSNPEVLAAAGFGQVLHDVFTYTVADRRGATDLAQLTISLDISAPRIDSGDPLYFQRLLDWPEPHGYELGYEPGIFVQPVVRQNALLDTVGRASSDGTRIGLVLDRGLVGYPRSLADGLGEVPGQFINETVRESQLAAQLELARFFGRHGRVSLTADGLLADPSLFSLTSDGLTKGEAQRPGLDAPTGAARQAADGETGEGAGDRPRQARTTAPAFSEQLRQAARQGAPLPR